MSDLDIKRELILSIPDIVLDSDEHNAHEELWYKDYYLMFYLIFIVI